MDEGIQELCFGGGGWDNVGLVDYMNIFIIKERGNGKFLVRVESGVDWTLLIVIYYTGKVGKRTRR